MNSTLRHPTNKFEVIIEANAVFQVVLRVTKENTRRRKKNKTKKHKGISTLGLTRKLIPQPWYKGAGVAEPLPVVFDMLQYFATILSLVESLRSS